MFKDLKIVFYAVMLIGMGIFIASCGNDNPVDTGSNETLLYEESGLVDSVVVTGCYDYTRFRFLNDTFYFGAYSKLRVEFESLTSSDRARISFVSYNAAVTNQILYTKNNEEVNMLHSFELSAPVDTTWLELRLYLSPQVCGENEYRFIRARDLKIYGIK
ncbi:MAG: hypothetical protein HOP31_11790 [Ignavibacteria bacterium]|nr:hypothetical protein [Ignavibacteria bacterium]